VLEVPNKCYCSPETAPEHITQAYMGLSYVACITHAGQCVQAAVCSVFSVIDNIQLT